MTTIKQKYAFWVLAAPNAFESYRVKALNNHGDAVGDGWAYKWNDLRDSTTPVRTILWNANGSGPDVVAVDKKGVDINDEGEILCAGPDFSDTFSAVISNGQNHSILPLPGRDYPYVTAKAINGGGIVTGSTSNPESGLFIYDSRAGTPIKFLGFDSKGYAINNHQQVAAVPIYPINDPRWGYNPPKLAFLIEDIYNSTPVKRDLGVVMSINDMNDLGDVVGKRIADGASEPTAYLCKTSGGLTEFHDLGVLPGYTGSEACAINNKGEVVGNLYSNNMNYPFSSSPFLRSSSGEMQDLNALLPANTPWYLQSPEDINENGQIVGMCQNTNGEIVPYIMTPIPDFAFDYQRLLGELYKLAGSGGSHVWFGPGTRPIPTDPRVLWEQITIEQQDVLIGIAVQTLTLFAQARSREVLEQNAIELISRSLMQLKRAGDL